MSIKSNEERKSFDLSLDYIHSIREMNDFCLINTQDFNGIIYGYNFILVKLYDDKYIFDLYIEPDNVNFNIVNKTLRILTVNNLNPKNIVASESIDNSCKNILTAIYSGGYKKQKHLEHNGLLELKQPTDEKTLNFMLAFFGVFGNPYLVKAIKSNEIDRPVLNSFFPNLSYVKVVKDNIARIRRINFYLNKLNEKEIKISNDNLTWKTENKRIQGIINNSEASMDDAFILHGIFTYYEKLDREAAKKQKKRHQSLMVEKSMAKRGLVKKDAV